MSVDNCKLYDWTQKWFFGEELTSRYGGLENLVAANGLKPTDENKNITGFRIMYDGDRILNEFAGKMLVEPEGDMEELTVNSYEEFKQKYIMRIKNKANGNDVTGLFNHKSGQMKLTYSDLKNYYISDEGATVGPKKYVDKLPEDFMDPDLVYDKTSVGKGTKALLLTTGEMPLLSAVVLKTSEYALGPKVVLIKNGKIAKESFAEYDEATDTVKIMERVYSPDGTRREYCLQEHEIGPQMESQILQRVEPYHVPAEAAHPHI